MIYYIKVLTAGGNYDIISYIHKKCFDGNKDFDLFMHREPTQRWKSDINVGIGLLPEQTVRKRERRKVVPFGLIAVID